MLKRKLRAQIGHDRNNDGGFAEEKLVPLPYD